MWTGKSIKSLFRLNEEEFDNLGIPKLILCNNDFLLTVCVYYEPVWAWFQPCYVSSLSLSAMPWRKKYDRKPFEQTKFALLSKDIIIFLSSQKKKEDYYGERDSFSHGNKKKQIK